MKISKESFKNLKIRQLNSPSGEGLENDVTETFDKARSYESAGVDFEAPARNDLSEKPKKYDPNKERPASAAKKYSGNNSRPASAAREQHFVSSGEKPQSAAYEYLVNRGGDDVFANSDRSAGTARGNAERSRPVSAAREQQYMSSGEKPQSAAYEYLTKKEDQAPVRSGRVRTTAVQSETPVDLPAVEAPADMQETIALATKPIFVEGASTIEKPMNLTGGADIPYPRPASSNTRPASGGARPYGSGGTLSTKPEVSASEPAAATGTAAAVPEEKPVKTAVKKTGKKAGGTAKKKAAKTAGSSAAKSSKKRVNGKLDPRLLTVLLVEIAFIITIITAMALDKGDVGRKDNAKDTGTETTATQETTAPQAQTLDHFDLKAVCHTVEKRAIGDETTDADSPVVKIAREQLGNYGGDPYWSWYGFTYHVPWCACFVSWVGNETGYLQDGKIPKYAVVDDGEYFYKNLGLWSEPGTTPQGGDIIFFDKNLDGYIDHTGIVSGTLDHRVFTIEGNTGFAEHGQDTDQESEEWLGICWRRGYEVDDPRIYGYGKVDHE